MNEISIKILEEFQIRKSKKQKERFRNFLMEELKKAGYDPKQQEKGSINNIILGDVEKANVIFTAHYDTCAVMPVPNFIIPNQLFGFILSQLLIVLIICLLAWPLSKVVAPILSMFELNKIAYQITILLIVLWMYYGKANKHTSNDNTSGVITLVEAALKLPQELREEVCFVFFDQEEVGLVGATAFVQEYKATVEHKLMINFDCVSDGDSLFFFPSKKAKADEDIHLLIMNSFLNKGRKTVTINKGFGFYPSDNLKFKNSYGVCALKKEIFYYMDRIHTPRDTVFDEENIDLLSDGIRKMVVNMKQTNIIHKMQKGKETFYEARGFKRIPHEFCGSGMRKVICK